MSIFKCPGSESIRFPQPDAVRCPGCGEELELWSDEEEVKCHVCGSPVLREMPASCWEWCSCARECIGPEKYDRLVKGRERRTRERKSLKEKLLQAIKTYFGDDEKRIGHAEAVAGFAEEMLKTGEGDTNVVLAASLLHDIGIPEAERKFGSARPRFQEQEGPPVARAIMEKLGIDSKVIDEVCEIIGHHHSPQTGESTNYKIVYDADQIVNLSEREESINNKQIHELIHERLLTDGGREMALRLFSKSVHPPGGV